MYLDKKENISAYFDFRHMKLKLSSVPKGSDPYTIGDCPFSCPEKKLIEKVTFL